MTAMSLAALLALALLTSAVAGPRLLRLAAPVLVRVPRLATGLLAGSLLGWLLAALTLGPMLAWATSGPALLTGRAADVCQRCLDSADPFDGTPVHTALPSIVLLAVPAAGASIIGAVVLRHAARRRRTTRATAATLAATATRGSLAGHQVLVIPGAERIAFALPRRHGGIVVSDGTLRVLDGDELTAVLAHEQAHLDQRHHLVTTLLEGIARALRPIPLVTAAADAIPHYLEIAADNAARHQAGTPALVSALLKLGDPQTAAGRPMGGDVLHAAGPGRVRHLVAPAPTRSGTGPALAAALYAATLGAVSITVLTPDLLAAVSICA